MAHAKTGAGFLHLNTPKEIKYTEGCVVSARELEAKPLSRKDVVRLPAYMHLVRKGIQEAVKRFSFAPLLDDTDEEAELPNVKPLPAPSRSTASSSAAQGGGGIDIVVNHLESGKCTFKLRDYDGVMDDAEVPMIVKDEEDAEKEEAMGQHTVYPWTMLDEERCAYEKLFALWKAKSSSNSATGHQHRKQTDGLLPNMATAVAGGKKRPRTEHGGGGPQPGDTSTAVSATNEGYFDDIDFAIRLAEGALM